MHSSGEFMPAGARAERAESFGAVAQEYERGRPGYPAEAIDWLLGPAPLEVLDLGAGTGKLTEGLLARGHRVTAVEPLAEMRALLAERLPGARLLAGTAEQLPLGDDSLDAVLVGAAFHWFEQHTALSEIARVLRPPGVLGLLGNAFDTSVGWAAALREILGPPAIQRPGHWPEPAVLRERFAEVEDREFAHSQTVERATLRDLACSRSSVAILPERERAQVLARIDALWSEYDELRGAERVRLPWTARVRRCRGVRTARPEGAVVVVAAADVRPLREEVLRPGQAAHELEFPGDEHPGTLHAAVLEDARIVAVASVMREDCPALPSAAGWRVRGMATLADRRGRGFGATLLARCEEHARNQGGSLLWCNARVGGRRFYERAGMTVLGERFELAGIGPHYLMFKELL